MPSIFKRPRSPFYFCSFRSADGRWLKKSTKTTDRKVALQFCMALENAAAGARSGELTAAQGRKLISEMVAFSSGERLEFHTAAGWFAEWLSNKAGSISAAALGRYRQVLHAFLAHLGKRANAPLASISPSEIVTFRDKLRAEGRAVSTTNGIIKKILAVPFSDAHRRGLILATPLASVDSLKDKARKSGREPFTHREVAALVASAEGDCRGAIILGATSGLRLGDVASLKWEALDMEAGLLRLETEKTGATVTIPLHSDFLAWIESRPRGIGKACVFPELAGKRISGRKGLSTQFREIMKAAGVVERIVEREGKGRTGHSKGFHALRHSFISELANAGIAPDIRQKLAGHSSAAIHAIYSHHELETLRGAVAKLPSLKAV